MAVEFELLAKLKNQTPVGTVISKELRQQFVQQLSLCATYVFRGPTIEPCLVTFGD